MQCEDSKQCKEGKCYCGNSDKPCVQGEECVEENGTKVCKKCGGRLCGEAEICFGDQCACGMYTCKDNELCAEDNSGTLKCWCGKKTCSDSEKCENKQGNTPECYCGEEKCTPPLTCGKKDGTPSCLCGNNKCKPNEDCTGTGDGTFTCKETTPKPDTDTTGD